MFIQHHACHFWVGSDSPNSNSKKLKIGKKVKEKIITIFSFTLSSLNSFRSKSWESRSKLEIIFIWDFVIHF